MENVKLHFTQELTEDAKFSCFVSDTNGGNLELSSEITIDLIGKYLLYLNVKILLCISSQL